MLDFRKCIEQYAYEPHTSDFFSWFGLFKRLNLLMHQCSIPVFLLVGFDDN